MFSRWFHIVFASLRDLAINPNTGARRSNFFVWIESNNQVVTWGKYGCGGESWQVQEQLKRGRVRQVSASAEAFAAILEDETVVTWGNDTGGGDSSGVQDQLRSVQEICGSEEAFAARLADGILLPGGVLFC